MLESEVLRGLLNKVTVIGKAYRGITCESKWNFVQFVTYLRHIFERLINVAVIRPVGHIISLVKSVSPVAG